jgi:hypothetical protein
MSQQQRINEYSGLTSQLMDYGWFVAPFIVGEEHERIKKLATYIAANPPPDDSARRAIEDKIHLELLDVAFSSRARARYVWLALRTPHIREYSHLYESAIFAITSASTRLLCACFWSHLRACSFRSMAGG